MCSNEGGIPVRVVLGVLVFFMFVLTQMMRTNLYLVIIEITNVKNTTAAQNGSTSAEVAWTRPQTGMLMGSVFWCAWLTELPGGVLATRLGGSRLLLASVLAAVLLNLATPLAVRLHFWAALAVRLLQGLVLGVSWPCVNALAARWIPVLERSKFMASFNGTAVGGALNYALSGVLIARLGWQSVFYLSGLLGALWCCAWARLAHDSPDQHPRISRAERSYLQASVSPDQKPRKIPWSGILGSGPFWAVLVTSQAAVWVSVTLSMQVPAYLSSVHHLGVAANGFIASLTEISKFVTGVIISAAIDSSMEKKKLSITAARKLAVTISILLPGLALVVLGCCAHHPVLAVAILVLASSASGASTSGNLANTVDISPNYAGIMIGLVKTVVVIPGSLAPLVASILVTDDDVVAGWNQLFCVTAALSTAGCLVFVFLGSGEVQPWNDYQPKLETATETEDLVQTKE
ncbi:sialin-like isoform X2 [Bacillus rossius redtenbacheri]|uniref:sialin-like isoform X2 n=1 Tax=Bacillus rossius redtenbacheri TaxID=93214 RepID=UPI002FDD9184